MSKEPQSRRAIDLGIDADTYAELCKLKPSKVFANFYDLRDDVYLDQVARSIGGPAHEKSTGVEVVVLRAPVPQR